MDELDRAMMAAGSRKTGVRPFRPDCALQTHFARREHVFRFAWMLTAYLAKGKSVRSTVRDMVTIVTSAEADAQERETAITTIMEAMRGHP